MNNICSFILRYYRQLFIACVIFLMVLPLGYMLGLQETTKLVGKDILTDLPSLQKKSFLKKDFQSDFEKWWNSHFFARKIALKLKNQLYDWANFNLIHSGYNNNVIQGKNHYLFEKYYFKSLNTKCLSIPHHQLLKLKLLHEKLKRKDINLYVILAPSKVLTYQELLPQRFTYFYNNDCHYHDKIEKNLNQMGVPVFNAQTLVNRIRETENYEPFSRTGTHWNFYGAGRTVQESLRAFSLADIKIKEIDTSLSPYWAEYDIAGLLNLLISFPKNETFPYPKFVSSVNFDGVTTIIGNSFSNEYKQILSNILKNNTIIHKENPPLSDLDAKNIMRSKRIFLVYTDIPFVETEDQLWKKIDVLLDNVNNVKEKILFANKTLPIEYRGLTAPGNWGRWSDGKKVIFNFNLEKSLNGIVLDFNVKAFVNNKHPSQVVYVKHNDKILAEWNFHYKQPAPKTTLIIPSDLISQNGSFQLEFDIQNPKSPYELGLSEDKRQLGIGFVSLTIK